MAKKPSFFDRIVGIFKAIPATEVARQREQKKRRKQPPRTAPPTAPRPVPIPTKDTFDDVPSEQVRDFNARTASLQELEWEIMNQNEPLEVRRAAAERWAQIAPKPLRPNMPYISGVGHDHFWMAFRDAYHETELW